MATYKVIQDIEADDKLIGPFGIRQFVYLLIVAVLGYVGYRASEITWFLGLPFLPFMFFFGLLALPFGGGQPTEVWLLAKFRFILKPKKHIWSQDRVRQLVTVTAPKTIEKHLTKELSQAEVRSRLQALADTLDSHGWSIKHVTAGAFGQQPAFASAGAGTDRLVEAGAPGQAPVSDVSSSDDMLDEQNNPTAQNLGRMVSASSRAHRDQLVAHMKQAAESGSTQPPQPSMNPPGSVAPPSEPPQIPPAPTPGPGARPARPSGQVVTPDPSVVQKKQQQATPPPQKRQLTEEELLEKIHAEQEKPKNYGHMRVVKPIEEQKAEAKARQAAQMESKPGAQQPRTPQAPSSEPAAPQAGTQTTQPVTPQPDPDIIKLANNDDLNVETIARQANKKKGDQPPDEVVIKLH